MATETENHAHLDASEIDEFLGESTETHDAEPSQDSSEEATQESKEEEQPEESSGDDISKIAEVLNASAIPAAPQTQSVAEVPKQEVPAPPTEPPKASLQDQFLPFVSTAEDLARALSTPEGFNKILTNAHATAMEGFLRTIPSVVKKLVTAEMMVEQKRQEFFGNNPDLVPFAPFVGNLANALQAKNPGWTIDQLLQETGKQANLAISRIKSSPNKSAPVVAPAPKARASSAPDLRGVEKDIAEMLAAL